MGEGGKNSLMFNILTFIKWLAILLHILEFQGSNLDMETRYLDWDSFVVFLSPSSQIPG
jgi:hypothetical protein